MAKKDDLGRRGEQIAADHLIELGYEIVERNWRCAHGELDIVARDGGDTVFVEVKTRGGEAFGHPFEAITAEKLTRLRQLASLWCASARPRPLSIRIDAVAVIAPRLGDVRIEHLERIA